MTFGYQNPWMQPMFGAPTFPSAFPPFPQQPFPQQFFPQTPPISGGGVPFQETSFIENILRLNRGKTAVVYMSFEGSQWGSKIFKGEILGAGKDHILLKDNQTNTTYLLLTIYLNYVTFDEPVEYEYPFNGSSLG